jgi:phytoene desaturase
LNSSIGTVVIIGSGVAGLAASIRLAHLGFRVKVYEQQPTYGGKMGEWVSKGFRFDTGPSLFTMPQYVDELLTIDEKKNVNFSYKKLDIVCNYFWQDGTKLTAFSDIDKLALEFENKLGEPKQNIFKALKKSKEKFNITNHVFLEKSLHRISTFLNLATLKSVFMLPKVNILTKMHKQNKSLFKNSKTVQFFDRYATYNGSNPYKAPATLNVIPHYEFGFGAFAPELGIRSIADVLYKKAVGLGVEFKFDSAVTSVEKRSTAYVINNAESVDILVCNMDVAAASVGPLANLLSAKKTKYEPSSSALIFYWGLNKSFTELDTHNIFFTEDYKKEFDCIFIDKAIAKDPTIYINITSKTNKADAPTDCENWFVMVNAPYVAHQNWDEMIEQAKSNILAKLSKLLHCDIANYIEVEHKLTPILIRDKTSSYKGALYGSSSNKLMSAFLRQPNFSRKHKGLYFCGGSVHPGGGIPLSLLSAKIMTDKISDDYNIH